MLVPVNTLLACPQVYVKPSLPLPTRSVSLGNIDLIIIIAVEFQPTFVVVPIDNYFHYGTVTDDISYGYVILLYPLLVQTFAFEPGPQIRIPD